MNPRNLQILDRVPASHSLRLAAAACLDLSEKLNDKRAAIERDPKLTSQGKQVAIREYVERTYLPSLKVAQAPIGHAAAELAAKREAFKISMPDRSDVAGAFERAEIRAWLRNMEPLQRMTLLLQNEDQRIEDAVLSAPPGLTDMIPEHFKQVLDRAVERRFGKEAGAVAAEQRIIDDANNAFLIAQNDAKAVAGLDDRAFDRMLQTTRGETPWLKRDGNRVVRVRPGQAAYAEASADEVASGKYYADADAWAADNPEAHALWVGEAVRKQQAAA